MGMGMALGGAAATTAGGSRGNLDLGGDGLVRIIFVDIVVDMEVVVDAAFLISLTVVRLMLFYGAREVFEVSFAFAYVFATASVSNLSHPRRPSPWSPS